jgi:hypothetical protein
MKTNRSVTGGEFLRIRVKKNKKEWTTISLERELVDLIKLVFQFNLDKEVKEFVKNIADSVDFNFTTYSQAVKREIYNKIGKKYKEIYNIIQPKLID